MDNVLAHLEQLGWHISDLVDEMERFGVPQEDLVVGLDRISVEAIAASLAGRAGLKREVKR